ncbi:MAG TPA: DEAD/DEAH box helicase [Alphaproteobacteria bacterium]|nr:DEAD/DEAH box helicase [Alphaproteobacteria bacterium]
MPFSKLGLGEGVLKAVSDSGYTEPTPIQAQAIPVILMGRDILGGAQTGTGKTASFALPMIDILAAGRAKSRMPRSLILEPTRELAAQVAEAFERYGKYHKLTMALLIGGVSMSEQIDAINRGPDVLIATPGRLIDLFERGQLLLNDTRILVIDEADRMLDMGFIPDVEKIASLVSRIRQTLFFSATMPSEIRRLAKKFLINPREISVSPPASVADTVTQGMVVVQHRDGRKPGGGAKEKRAALRALIKNEKVKNALVFCNRKRDVAIVRKSLTRHGFSADELHGDMSQPARMEALGKFKNGDFTFMVCSDVAARGLDIANMSHVFNFDVPIHPEDYVHRIGRTGRAGKKGRALTLAVPEDGKYLEAIIKLTGKNIPKIDLESIGGAELEKGDAGSRGGRGGNRNKGHGHGHGREKTSAGRQASKQAGKNVKSDAPHDPEPPKSHGPKPHRERGAKSGNRGGGPGAGMGDHAPAFLLRRPKGK